MGGYPREGLVNMEESRRWIAVLALFTGYEYLRSPGGAQPCFFFFFFALFLSSGLYAPCFRAAPFRVSLTSRWEDDEVTHDPYLC